MVTGVRYSASLASGVVATVASPEPPEALRLELAVATLAEDERAASESPEDVEVEAALDEAAGAGDEDAGA